MCRAAAPFGRFASRSARQGGIVQDTQITRRVAVYGAVVSTAIAAWTIYRDLRDKGRLRVELEIGRRTQGGIITHRDPMTTADHCVVTITNVGRRPITASHLLG